MYMWFLKKKRKISVELVFLFLYVKKVNQKDKEIYRYIGINSHKKNIKSYEKIIDK